jgi:hypothetical protein
MNLAPSFHRSTYLTPSLGARSFVWTLTARYQKYRGWVLFFVFFFLAALSFPVLLLWAAPILKPDWTKLNPTEQAEWLKLFAQAMLAAFGATGLMLGYRRLRVASDGMITDRFSRAVEQLGAHAEGRPLCEVRIGAIHSLERLALDSRSDCEAVIKVLTSYLRQHCIPPDESTPAAGTVSLEIEDETQERKRLKQEDRGKRAIVQAVLNTVGKLNSRRSALDRKHTPLDLRYLDLRGYEFLNLNLQHCQLRETDVSGSTFAVVDARQSEWNKVIAKGCTFTSVKLEDAQMRSAVLEDAQFRNVWLDGADLTGAAIERSMFQEKVTVYRAILLVRDQTYEELAALMQRKMLRGDRSTKLPEKDHDTQSAARPIPDYESPSTAIAPIGTDELNEAEGSVLSALNSPSTAATSASGDLE